MDASLAPASRRTASRSGAAVPAFIVLFETLLVILVTVGFVLMVTEARTVARDFKELLGLDVGLDPWKLAWRAGEAALIVGTALCAAVVAWKSWRRPAYTSGLGRAGLLAAALVNVAEALSSFIGVFDDANYPGDVIFGAAMVLVLLALARAEFALAKQVAPSAELALTG
jgi:hypothetical protein